MTHSDQSAQVRPTLIKRRRISVDGGRRLSRSPSLGAFIGLMSSKNGGRNFCLIVAAFGAFRLFLGGGIL